MIDFSKLALNDAEITHVQTEGDALVVTYRDWKEIGHQLRFINVAGYQWFSPEGKSLSHGAVASDDPFIRQACLAADEDGPAGFFAFSFISAWSESPVLKIVAKDVVSPT